MKENKRKNIPAEQRNQHQLNPLQTDHQLKNIQPLQQSQHHLDAFKSKVLKQMHFQNDSRIKSDKTTTAKNHDKFLPQKETYDNCYQVPKPAISKFQSSSTDPVLKPWNFQFPLSYDPHHSFMKNTTSIINNLAQLPIIRLTDIINHLAQVHTTLIVSHQHRCILVSGVHKNNRHAQILSK